MESKIDKLFIRLANLYRAIEENGFMKVNTIEEKDIIDEFYNKSINMIKCGRMPEHIDLILSFDLAKALRDKNIDDETLKCLIVIKKLIEPIRNLEYDNIIQFAREWASTDVYRKINDHILQKYVARDFEDADAKEVCRIRFDD